MRILVGALLLTTFAFGQELHMPVFNRLKSQASNVVDLNLSKDLLGLGAGFLGRDKDGEKVKKVVSGLNNIVIHSLEFDKEGVYNDADVADLIRELGAPDWKLVVSAEEKKNHEASRIWIKSAANGALGGMRILTAERKELTVVEITGRISPEDLKDLGGLNIPGLAGEHEGQGQKKNDE